jgi:hypothetical protein
LEFKAVSIFKQPVGWLFSAGSFGFLPEDRQEAMSEKHKVWKDMLAAMEKLGMPVSAKRRNYFLRA